MPQKSRQSNNISSSKEEFDFDAYLEKQSGSIDDKPKPPGRFPSTIKNTLLIIAASVLGFLWYFDWEPLTNADDFFGLSGENPAEVTAEAGNQGYTEEVVIYNDEVFVNETNQPSSSSLEISYTDYLEILNNGGFLEDLGASSTAELYENGVPPEYLSALNDTGVFEDFGGSSISRL